MSEYSARIYRLIFAAAAAYNIAFGLWAALAPQAFFTLFRLDPPRYPSIWACLGMVVGLYGVAYAYAAWRLDRAFPLIAIGLAGKILGPIGWPMSELPFNTFPLIVFDDLMWWVPFGLFLLEGTAIARFLKRTAPYWCAAVHVIAAVGTLLLIGGPSYTGSNPVAWRAGWLIWMFGAVTLLGFYAWWGSRAPLRPALIAFTIAALGMTCDFAGESILIGWLPRAGTSLDRIAALLTGGAANGLYTIAGIMLTIATPLPPLLRAWAWAGWLSGIALTFATIAGSSQAVVISSAALIALFTPWVAVMGWRLR